MKLLYKSKIVLWFLAVFVPTVPAQDFAGSFISLGCKGIFDSSIFARLQRMCDDCFYLYNELEVYASCRKNCFTTDAFVGCLEALYYKDELKDFEQKIDYTAGRK